MRKMKFCASTRRAQGNLADGMAAVDASDSMPATWKAPRPCRYLLPLLRAGGIGLQQLGESARLVHGGTNRHLDRF